jgi:branched-chain amino acid transport system ATP-binding protein
MISFPDMSQPILKVNGLTMDFGGIRALNSLDLDVKEGEIAALIGPNGAGKTTFFNCLTGIYRPTKGEIFLHQSKLGKTISLLGLKPNQVTEKGLARTFQNIRLFSQMTVLENVMIGRHCRTKAFILGALLRGRGTMKEEQEIVSKSHEILEKVGLAQFVNEFAKNLPYGAQRRLEIARALATEPTLLLLDEPAAGMNPQETIELVNLIQEIASDGQSILLIEHDMKLVMSLSDRIFVMDYGKKIAQGSPEDIRNNPAVIKAYLGEEVDA